MVEKDRRLAVGIGSIIGLLVISQSAFSKKIHGLIWKRDEGKSVVSGETKRLHAAHYDHERNDHYDTVENGRMLTIKEHYEDHLFRRGENGLSQTHNHWALNAIWGNLTPNEKSGLIPPQLDGGVVYEEPYEREVNGETVMVLGHDRENYVVFDGTDSKVISGNDLFD